MQIVSEADAGRRYAMTGLSLPPMIQNRHTECRLHPGLGIIVTVFPSDENPLQGLQGIPGPEGYVRVFPFYHSEGRGDREQCIHLVLIDDSK